MENMEKGNLENKFCSYLKDLKIRYSNFGEVKQTIDSFCNENNLQNKKVFTDYCIGKISDLCNFWTAITLDDVKKFLDEYLSDGKKISFLTLNSLIACMKSKVCSLKEWRDFIETYVHQSEHHSELDEKINFFRNLDSVVDLEKESLDKANASAAKFFSDWQSKIIGISNITNNNYMSINYLAIELLEFKAKTKQYSKVENIRDDILSYIEKIVLLSKKQNNLPGNVLAHYFNALLTASIGDKKCKQKVFDGEFIKRIREKILGNNKKISNIYQILFLFGILKFNYDLNLKSSLRKHIAHTTKYQFDEAYNFIFGDQDIDKIKTIVGDIKDKCREQIVIYCLSLIYLESIDIDSKSFRDFCDIFGLSIEKNQQPQLGITGKPSRSEKVKQKIEDYLSDYSLKQNEIEIKNINKICIENQYGSELYIQNEYGKKKIFSLESCISKKDKQRLVYCNIKISSSYKKNSRAYEIFAATAFLIFGFIPLIILKSVFDILFLPIKAIINIFHSAITAFKRKEYLWKFPDFKNETEGHLGMFLHILIDLIVGLLFIAFSPIICLYNNFFGSKYLFHKSGTGQKLITFNNWRFYKKQSDSDRAKNFGLAEINLWFVIKYIFGFACLAKSKDSELKMELKLTDNNQLDKKSGILKLSDEILKKYSPGIALTNEYSPLSYLETIR